MRRRRSPLRRLGIAVLAAWTWCAGLFRRESRRACLIRCIRAEPPKRIGAATTPNAVRSHH
jgi:hypothetical protein